MKIGILALQGAYQAHASCLGQINVTPLLVRNATELAYTDGLIIPGGESSVFIKLLQESTLWADLLKYKRPIFGTCAGAILLAKHVVSPIQPSLNRVDMTLERNAYGRQVDSKVQKGQCLLTQSEMEMMFIRAPKIKTINEKKIKILATCGDHPVAVQQDNCIASTFHPELGTDTTLHNYFVQMIKLDRV